MEKYTITQNTIYLKGRKENGIIKTEILELGGKPFTLDLRPQEIMNASCRFYGEKYNERRSYTKRITGIVSKPPILVSPVTTSYFFCAFSERKLDNTWINLIYVKKLIDLKGKTKVKFEQEQDLILPVSYHVLNLQYLKAAFLYYKNQQNNLFIKNLNSSNLNLQYDSYKVLEILKLYLNNSN